MDSILTEIQTSMEEPLTLQNENDTSLFSFFKAPINVKNKQPYKSIRIKDVLSVIQGDHYKGRNEELITLTGKQQQDYKKEKLDFVTFSGTFKHRAIDGLINRSTYFCVDIDHIGDTEKIELVKKQILAILTPVLMFISPRREGLKVTLSIVPEDGTHEEYYRTIEIYFNNIVLSGLLDTAGNPLKIDSACKEVCRATFLPHDPNCYYSENPTIIDRVYIDTFAQEQPQVTVPDTEICSEIIETALTMIRNSVDGQKYPVLLRASVLTGGFIAGGLIDESEAISLLEKEIRQKDILDFAHAQKTIRQGINYGKTKPIYRQAQKQRKKSILVPPFPIDGLPDQLQFLIKTYSKTYGTHPDLWAGAFILATSLGIGQSVKLKTKYTNAPCLWFIFIAPSGVGKTEPLKTALAPFVAIDNLRYSDFKANMEEYEKWKNTPKDDRLVVSMDLPVNIQFALQDFTPEALSKVHSDNPRGIVIYRDELAGWIKDFNRYNKSGEQENYLSAFMGDAFVANRKSQIIRIKEPFINVAGGLQPDLINLFAKENRDMNGFLVRFCHIFPDKAVKPYYNNKVIPDDVKQKYFQYINNLLSLPYNPESPEFIFLSDEAQAIYEKWFNGNTEATNNSGEDYLRGVYSKLDIISLRLALTIHFSKWAFTGVTEEKITPETMQAALDITEYFRITGTKVFYHLQPSEEKVISNREAARFLSAKGISQNDISGILNCSQQNIQRFLK